MAAMLKSSLPLPVKRGKVRDVYDLGSELLIVATDRISAFDVIMKEGIPDKGKILTALSLFWFETVARDDNHLITTDLAKYPRELQLFEEKLVGRSMLVKKAEVIPFECVARGYLAGSGWKEYQATGKVCGIGLTKGLRQCEELPEPIFTPATKESSGHDQNVSFEVMEKAIGRKVAEELRSRTLALYKAAARLALDRGVIIADTKFEFGHCDGKIILIDEILTPDSSRFWPASGYAPGKDQPSFDKQFVRNWLEVQGWNKQPPPPALPPNVIEGTRKKYIEAYTRLTRRQPDFLDVEPG
jgi:phosphoribosylaminoimidazole-succinocarboxamide synthase